MGIQYIQIDHGANKMTSNRIFDLSQQLLDGVNLELIRTIMNLYLYGELEGIDASKTTETGLDIILNTLTPTIKVKEDSHARSQQ